MRRLLRVPLFAAVVTFLFCGHAMAAPKFDPAGFLDCTMPGDTFSTTIDKEGEWTCAEVARRSLDGGKGYFVPTRILRSSDLKKGTFSKQAPKLLDTVEKSLKIWRGSADIGLPGLISIVLIDRAMSDELGVDRHGHGVTSQQLGKHECLVVVNVAGIERDYKEGIKKPIDLSKRPNPHGAKLPPDPDADYDAWVMAPNTTEIPRHIQKVVAHEAAHCVQDWWSPDTAKLSESGAKWWVEGSAEMLASLAVPRAVGTLERYKLFDQRAAEKPLIEMSYESVVFFQWLWSQGPQKVFDLMKAMPDDHEGFAPQGEALKKFLKPDELARAPELQGHDLLDGGLHAPREAQGFSGAALRIHALRPVPDLHRYEGAGQVPCWRVGRLEGGSTIFRSSRESIPGSSARAAG